jgi:hypothetical protein
VLFNASTVLGTKNFWKNFFRTAASGPFGPVRALDAHESEARISAVPHRNRTLSHFGAFGAFASDNTFVLSDASTVLGTIFTLSVFLLRFSDFCCSHCRNRTNFT